MKKIFLLHASFLLMPFLSHTMKPTKKFNQKSTDTLQNKIYCDLNLQAPIVQSLIDQGANPNGTDSSGSPFLLLALERNCSIEVLKTLLDAGADVNATDGYLSAFNFACSQGKADAVELFMAHNPDLKKKSGISQTSSLHYCLDNPNNGDDRDTIAKLLLSKGCSANHANTRGVTSLHVAASHGHLKSVALLLEHDACVNAKDNQKNTPLHSCLLNANIPLFIRKHIAALLLQHNADKNSSNCNNETPVDLAKKHAMNLDTLLDSLYEEHERFQETVQEAQEVSAKLSIAE